MESPLFASSPQQTVPYKPYQSRRQRIASTTSPSSNSSEPVPSYPPLPTASSLPYQPRLKKTDRSALGYDPQKEAEDRKRAREAEIRPFDGLKDELTLTRLKEVFSSPVEPSSQVRGRKTQLVKKGVQDTAQVTREAIDTSKNVIKDALQKREQPGTENGQDIPLEIIQAPLGKGKGKAIAPEELI